MESASSAAATAASGLLNSLHIHSVASNGSEANSSETRLSGNVGQPSSRREQGGQRSNRGRGRGRRGETTLQARGARDARQATQLDSGDPAAPEALGSSSSTPVASNLPAHTKSTTAGSGPSRRRGKGKSNTDKAKPDGPPSLVADTQGKGEGSQTESQSRLANRRKQFGGKLTGNGSTSVEASETEGPSNAASTSKVESRQKSKAIPRTVAAGEPVEYADLRSRLLAELSSGQYDCVVCYSTITTRQAVWSCSQCYTVLHLGCVRKWAEGSVKKAEEYNAMQEDPEIRNRRGTWRCPGCQYAREDVPKVYWCWCGRVADPPGGRGSNPHGCGQRCSRGKCSHGCADSCHPGPCPPCAVTVSQKCFCGAQTIPMRCSQTTSKEVKLSTLHQKGTSCGSLCGKKLDCGIHTCDQICHPGDCQPCSVQLEARCYCSKETRTLRCGEGNIQQTYDDQLGSFEGRFACDEQCSRPFDCGLHRCSRPCHPRDVQAARCPSSPDLIKTCPCGSQPISGRTSCQDVIPTCDNICSKPLPCGHSCPSPCHLGPCPPCLVSVSTPCRCGETKQSRPCHERQREESEGNQEVLCHTTCKAQRNCGRHQCGRQCCPLYFQAKSKAKKRPTMAELQAMDPAGFHECSIPCGKPLACGLHECPMTCHRGACPPCLQASFEELSCHCGRTVLEPPVPCGTQVRCSFPCVRPPPPCGHPKLPHDCHEEERCPPCVYLSDKICHCQKNIVKNVPCSRSRVSCGQPCDALLNCGYHRCQGICHIASNECAPCVQICGKPRKLCQHPCSEKCHAPSSCPETEPCEAVITLQCPCGNLQSRAKCGVSIHAPNKEKSLKCNDSCLIAQRNAKLAEALGLNPAEKTAPATYEHETLAFYAHAPNRRFCDELEAALNDFIRSPRAGMILPPANKLQRKFAHELAGVYKLGSESVDNEPRRSVSIRRKQDSRIPSPLISEAFAAAKISLLNSQEQQNRPAGLAQLRRPGSEAPRPLNAVYLPGVFGHDQESLRCLLQPVLRTINFTMTWKGDEDVLITSPDAPTRLVMMKTELKSLVRREPFARDVILCTADAAKNIIRREDEPASSSSRGITAGAWGTTPISRSQTGGANSSKSTVSNGASRGWAAVASGSGRNSPATQSEQSWLQTKASSSLAPGSHEPRPAALSAAVIPNPNAPSRAAKTIAPRTSQDVVQGSVPEDWEDS